MSEKKILIIDTVHEAFQQIVNEFGFSCVEGTKWSKDEVLKILPAYEGVVIRSRFRLDEDFFNAASHLRFVARSGAGMENIDEAAAAKHNVTLINAPEGNRDAVAEHALAMLLSLLNRIVIADDEVRNGIWKRAENRGVELKGKTVAIIGFGNMGSAFALRLSGFGVTVLAYDPFIAIDKSLNPQVNQVTMDYIYRNADVVSLHVPLTSETLYMVNDQWLNNFEKNIYLINTARGKVIRTSSLVNAMKSGKIIGACLDVSEYESTSFEDFSLNDLPPDWKFLISNDNVILSPHIAGWTHESYRKLSEVMADKVVKLYK